MRELRAQRVKLWLPPYVNPDQSPNDASLDELSKRLSSSLPDCTSEDIQSAVLSLQTHSLEKLRQKKQSAAIRTNLSCLEIKILGLTKEDMSHNDVPKAWANRIEIQPKALKLWDVNPHLTVASFAEELMVMLNVSSVRLVHRGKSVSLTDTRFLVEVVVLLLLPVALVALPPCYVLRHPTVPPTSCLQIKVWWTLFVVLPR